MKTTSSETVNLGRCDNHIDNMTYGGLVPKGARCSNKATGLMVYIETLNPWDGTPNTTETTKLCDACLAHVKQHVRAVKQRRLYTRGKGAGKWWPRQIAWFKPQDITAEHVRALCKSYKGVPQSLLDQFNLDRDGRPHTPESLQRAQSLEEFLQVMGATP